MSSRWLKLSLQRFGATCLQPISTARPELCFHEAGLDNKAGAAISVERLENEAIGLYV